MSEDFVDVSWRGLELVANARLRSLGPTTAYVEHGSPMPTGTVLSVRTVDGLELSASVARVYEQIGGRTDPPGMELTITAIGAAAAWWGARVVAVATVPTESRTKTLDPSTVAAARPAWRPRSRRSLMWRRAT
jgi:hypothetical protein